MAQPLRELMRCVPQDYQIYRYILEVRLVATGPRLTVVLKNPSTASATRSDPTIGKVESWARQAGFGSVAYVNLFALRATKAIALNQYEYVYTIGPENDLYIRQAVEAADTVVAAWGNPNGILPERYNQRIGEVLSLLDSQSDLTRLQIVGNRTQQGHPRHGLLWNYTPQLSDF